MLGLPMLVSLLCSAGCAVLPLAECLKEVKQQQAAETPALACTAATLTAHLHHTAAASQARSPIGGIKVSLSCAGQDLCLHILPAGPVLDSSPVDLDDLKPPQWPSLVGCPLYSSPASFLIFAASTWANHISAYGYPHHFYISYKSRNNQECI
jgi:hypothetical protein